ncbi:hypothetical protein VA602_23485 [Pseudomonas sp. MH2]|uniref:Glycine zipper 2TM domain-containing protein n=1 Tax=Pseudomonas machongensis TaxID=3110229 RepID=A0ABU5VPJ7_9PSED|nr:hypothetical protein [Pseudomonas sp. MH2]MEA5674285.1 hypothetical protein [Pseudomonas sp. MH2]
MDAPIAATVGGATQGRGLGFTLGAGAGGSYLGSLIKGEDPTYSLLGAILGGVVGFRTGQDARISIDAFKSASYEGQMKLATKDLLGAIQQGQVKASSFTAKQLQQISAGAKKIDG